ncbi:MAG: UvrD-helicase domain-containing protein [Acidobacteria bacterium]|nr:UvrD-helicase domain-containing protein [Acidobacteriota bacterium]
MSGPGREELLRREDGDARRRAQRELAGPVAVEAGAGTGKTSVLVARVLAWCLGPGWEESRARLARDGVEPGTADVAAATVEGVVAITFTEAAAAEMEQRVAHALVSIERGEAVTGFELPVPAGEASQRARALLSALHRFPVSTIHGFCSRLLGRYPVQAGVAPGFVVDTDGLATSREARAVVEEAMARAAGGLPEGWRELAAAGFGPGQIVEALEILAEHGVPPEALEEDPFPSDRVETILAGARTACAELVRLVVDGMGSSGTGRDLGPRIPPALDTIVAALDACSGSSPGERFAVFAAAAKAFPSKLLDRLRSWADGTLNKKEEKSFAANLDRVASLAGRVADPLTLGQEVDPELLRAAYRALGPLLAALHTRLRAKGIMTFRGLLTGAASLLTNGEIAAEVRRGIRQLLVDEFQDTDPVQCAIIRKLALEGPLEERPGLFVVGDPKQSIYGWRSADLAAYEAFVEEMQRAGGIELRLSVNFRSVAPLLAEVTNAVEPVMRPEPGLQPAFQPLLPSGPAALNPDPLPEGRAPVEYWVSWDVDPESGRTSPGTAVAAQRRIEARAVASDIRELHARHGVPWNGFGILFRTMSQAEPYMEALRSRRVPYAVAKERMYFRRREIVEIAAVVRAILDPADRMALLTVLRSDVVGVPDAALPALWRGGLPGLMLELDDPGELSRVGDLLDRAAAHVPPGAPGLDALPGWPAAAIGALDTLAVLRASWRTDPAPVFVERLRTLWGAEMTAASRTLGRFRIQLLERFFDDLLRVLVETGGRSAEVTRFLRRAVSEERELEGSPTAEGGDAVQVMTIHGAKGLEFEHVYLVDMAHGSRNRSAPEHAVLTGARGPALRLFGSPSLAYVEAAQRVERVSGAERVRLLYVAMTRAKRRLVLAGGWPSKVTAKTVGNARNLLDLIVHRGGELMPVEAAGTGEPRMARGEHAVLVFPALLETREDGTSEEDGGERNDAHGGAAFPAERIRSDAARLAVARREAARIQDRPFVVTSTGLAHGDPDLEADTGEPPSSGPGRRAVARAVGTAIHRVIEELDLSAGAAPEAPRLKAVAEALLERLVPPVGRKAAFERLERIFKGLAGGTCLGRLADIASHVIARELPVLLGPGEGTDVGGFISGCADLVYRDPGDGRLVVADYKTDTIGSREVLERRTEEYARQVAVYVRALTEAFPAEPLPRAELWFLAEDLIVPVGELS